MKSVAVSLVGFGNRGQSVGSAIAESQNYELVSVCDQLPERRETARSELDVKTDKYLEDSLERDPVEAVVIMTGTKYHAPLSIDALESGMHVLCAKPLAQTVEEAARMVEAADREGLVGAVGYQKRFFPDVWTLRKAATKCDPQQVLLTNQRGIYYSRFFRPGYAWGILDGTGHWIDVANWIVDYTPVSVSGTVRHGMFTDTETIDMVTIHIEYTEGQSASITASMGGPGLSSTREVVGRDGNAEVKGDQVDIRDITFDDNYEEKDRQRVTERTIDVQAPGPGSPTRTLLDQFAARIRGEGGDELPTFRDGFESLAVAKAALHSHERTETVHVGAIAPELGPG